MRASSRETCIWLMPTSSAISVCVLSWKKRSSHDRALALGQIGEHRVEQDPVLGDVEVRDPPSPRRRSSVVGSSVVAGRVSSDAER